MTPVASYNFVWSKIYATKRVFLIKMHQNVFDAWFYLVSLLLWLRAGKRKQWVGKKEGMWFCVFLVLFRSEVNFTSCLLAYFNVCFFSLGIRYQCSSLRVKLFCLKWPVMCWLGCSVIFIVQPRSCVASVYHCLEWCNIQCNKCRLNHCLECIRLFNTHLYHFRQWSDIADLPVLIRSFPQVLYIHHFRVHFADCATFHHILRCTPSILYACWPLHAVYHVAIYYVHPARPDLLVHCRKLEIWCLIYPCISIIIRPLISNHLLTINQIFAFFS